MRLNYTDIQTRTAATSHGPKLPALLLMVFVCLLCIHSSTAQDLHFSQYNNNPLLTNPANTGFNPDHDYRVGASYRSQWAALPVPYTTMSVWGDWQMMRDRFNNGWMGIGGVLLRDKAGSGDLVSTKAYGSIAYHQQLGEGSLLSAGFNVGYASKSIDLSHFTWESQWNGKFFDAGLPNGESFAYSQIGYVDLQAGVNYAWFGYGNFYFNAGASIMHVNMPRESFFDKNTVQGDTRIAQRYTGFANASYKLNNQWILNPSVYSSLQTKSLELVGGMMAQYNLSGDGATQLIGGAYYRLNDAAIGMVGLQWSDIRLSFSYDATMSNLRNYNGTQGALEFSLIKFGTFRGRAPRDSKCPSF